MRWVLVYNNRRGIRPCSGAVPRAARATFRLLGDSTAPSRRGEWAPGQYRRPRRRRRRRARGRRAGGAGPGRPGGPWAPGAAHGAARRGPGSSGGAAWKQARRGEGAAAGGGAAEAGRGRGGGGERGRGQERAAGGPPAGTPADLYPPPCPPPYSPAVLHSTRLPPSPGGRALYRCPPSLPGYLPPARIPIPSPPGGGEGAHPAYLSPTGHATHGACAKYTLRLQPPPPLGDTQIVGDTPRDLDGSWPGWAPLPYTRRSGGARSAGGGRR